MKETILSCTSTPPRRLHLTKPIFRLMSYVDRKPLLENTSLRALRPLSICGMPDSSMKHRFLRNRCPVKLLSPPKVTPTRVWLPSRTCVVLEHPLKASFSPQRFQVSLSKAFLLLGDREKVSLLPLRSCAFLPNPSAWYRRSSDFSSHLKSRPPSCYPKS